MKISLKYIPIPAIRPNKNRIERITERKEPNVIVLLLNRPVLYDPKEYYFNKFNIFPINILYKYLIIQLYNYILNCKMVRLHATLTS